MTKNKYTISYSQSVTMKECPRKWYLRYIKKERIEEPSIFLVFGNTMHIVLQDWIDVVYNKSKKEAMEVDLIKNFENKLFDIYKKQHDKHGKFVELEDIEEIISEGKTIIYDFKKKWFDYFGVRGWNLYGIEKHINYKIKEKENLNFYGRADIILQDKNEDDYYLIDLKTTFAGWNKDKLRKKRDQLLYYKYYLSKQENIELDNIIPMFIFLRRKIFGEENMPYKVSHVSKEIPPSKRALKKSINNFYDIINEYYTLDSDNKIIKLKEDNEYKETPSKDACKWCEYKGTEFCRVT